MNEVAAAALEAQRKLEEEEARRLQKAKEEEEAKLKKAIEDKAKAEKEKKEAENEKNNDKIKNANKKIQEADQQFNNAQLEKLKLQQQEITKNRLIAKKKKEEEKQKEDLKRKQQEENALLLIKQQDAQKKALEDKERQAQIKQENLKNMYKTSKVEYTYGDNKAYNIVNTKKEDHPLRGICCLYDTITNKFSFFRDLRNDKGRPNIYNSAQQTGTIRKFNIDWRIEKNKDRNIQLNMGWMLGYREEYYSYDTKYIEVSKVNVDNTYGFGGESMFKPLSTNYIFLSVNDYNNNFTPSLLSPFSVSTFNDNNILAKINTLDGKTIYNSGNYNINSVRQYFGPINIKKLEIKLLDEFGRVIDLNNLDYSFTLALEILYD